MGSDDLFHKRKAKSKKDLDRKKSFRAVYEKILIVTEGSKTEPLYFMEIKDFYEINTANIVITGDCGSDPLSVVNCAEELYQKEVGKGDAFDKVYIVIDKDTHANYAQALTKVSELARSNPFLLINSVPCFEYWLLLHYCYTTSAFHANGKVSSGGAVLAALRRYLPAYEKAQEGIFKLLFNKLDYAIENAIRSLTQATEVNTDNPTTHIHELVILMRDIKK